MPGNEGKIIEERFGSEIIAWIARDPDITNAEIARRIKELYGVEVSQMTVGNWRKNYVDFERIQRIKETLPSSPEYKTVEENLLDEIKRRLSLLIEMNKQDFNPRTEDVIVRYYKLLFDIQSRASVEAKRKERIALIENVMMRMIEVFRTIVELTDEQKETLKNEVTKLYNELISA